jgi:hypothetical protein
MNAMTRTSRFVYHAFAVRPCCSSQPGYAQRPSWVSVLAGAAHPCSGRAARRPTWITAQGIGFASLLLAIVLIELYAMRQIYLQLSNVPVQVELTFDPSDVFQVR